MVMLYAALTLGGIGVIFGILLSVAAKVFAVEVDERVEAINECLPGANCGACGYAGCSNFAEAVCKGEAEAGDCIPGGKETSQEIAKILGQDCAEQVPLVAVVYCIGDRNNARDSFVYHGSPSCKHAAQMAGGFKACAYGCLGMGDCVDACPFDAMEMGDHGLPEIDRDRCEGCGLCVKACPRDIIKTVPQDFQYYQVLCNSRDRGKSVLNACSVGCNACRACIKACPQEAIALDNNLAVIDMNKCDGCGECVAKCRQGTIRTLEEGKKAEKEAAASA